MTRSWPMFAGRMTDRGRMHVYPDERTVRAYGDDPVPVVAVEDPDGGHWGWLGYAYLHYPADETPVMVQPHRGMFDMQFAYGARAEADAGKGEIVRLRIEDVE